jgi:alpha-tubulin suppressor-like RCC1 family protein
MPVHAVPWLASVREMAFGSRDTCAIDTRGVYSCWEPEGDLLDSPPASVVPVVNDAVALGAGADFACVATSSGHVLCWGQNDYGQLGDKTRHARWEPMPIREAD